MSTVKSVTSSGVKSMKGTVTHCTFYLYSTMYCGCHGNIALCILWECALYSSPTARYTIQVCGAITPPFIFSTPFFSHSLWLCFYVPIG